MGNWLEEGAGPVGASTVDDSMDRLKKNKLESYNTDEIRKKMFANTGVVQSFCTLVYGKDGTGKTGIVQSYPLEGNEKMVIVDLDGGNLPLVLHVNSAKKDNIIVFNPIEFGDAEPIDYIRTVSNIHHAIRFVKENYQKENIRAFCIDGLSTLLKHAEYVMRIEKNLTPDQGVSQRYWVNRMKIFMEILESAKALPVDVFFIAHDDFIKEDKELSAAKVKTNQMVYQKIRCLREELPNGEVKFVAIIDKSKFDITAEGEKIEFARKKADRSYTWTGDKVLQRIGGKKL